MAIQSTEVLPDNTLEEFRIEFNKLITDVSGLSLGNTFSTQIIFEGDTEDTFETGISVTDPTADRSIIFPDQSGNVLLDSANINLVDNIELQFGTGSDLKIYHDGSHSYIDDAGTGSLLIRSNQIELKKQSSDEKMATFAEDGAITLYHNNVEILATAATGISVAGDVTATDDLNLTSDAAVLSFGENSEVTLTHVHNDGLLLNADNQLQFRDNAINIRSPADGDLDINADDEIELNSTLIDINGNVEISGTLAQVGVATFTARDIHSGGITIANDGTIGSVGDADAITISSAGVVTFSQTPVFSGDSTFSDDISLTSDGAIINFGENSEVTLTHVHDDGLLLNTDMQLQFRDSAINIRSDADGDLDINADDEIELNSTLIDVNGNLDVSGTYAGAGLMTLTTASGENKLTVRADAASQQASLSLQVQADTPGQTVIYFGKVGATTNGQVGYNPTNDKMTFFTNNSEKMSLTTAGLLTITDDLVIKTGGTIGGANDTDLLTLTSAVLTVAGEVVGTGFTGTLDGVLGGGTPAAVSATTVTASGLIKSTGAGNISIASVSTGNSYSTLTLQNSEQNYSAQIRTDQSQAFVIRDETAGANRFLLSTGGKVGIGNVPTADQLTVAGDVRIKASGGRLTYFNSDAAYSLGSSGGAAIRFVETSGSQEIDFETHHTGNSHAARMRISKEGDLALLTDGVELSFGANSEVTLTHVHDVGLTLKHTATADDKPIILTLATGETDIAADDILGGIQFQAPDEGTGTDAILVAAGILAISEGNFAADNNATTLSFRTGASAAASERLRLTSEGKLEAPSPVSETGLQAFTIDWYNENNAGIMASIGCDRTASSAAPGDLVFRTSTSVDSGAISEKMRVTSAGKVGIGTAAPINNLQVHTSASSGGQIQIGNASTGATTGDGVLIGFDGSNDVIINNKEATQMKFYTSGTERMSISAAGNIVAPQIAKGWCSFNGTGTPALNAGSYNVASLTDNGAGDYDVVWATDFANGNYAVAVSTNEENGIPAFAMYTQNATTDVRVLVATHAGTFKDQTFNSCIAFGAQ